MNTIQKHYRLVNFWSLILMTLFQVPILLKANDIDSANYYNDLSLELRDTWPDSSLIYAQRALSLGIQSNNKKEIARAYANQGSALSKKTEFAQAFQYLDQSNELFLTLEDYADVARNQITRAKMYYFMGDMDQAAAATDDAYEKAKLVGDPFLISNAINGLGIIYHSQRKHDQAKECYEKALELRRRIDRPDYVASSLSNIGSVLRDIGSYTDALPYFEEALDIAQQEGNRLSEADYIANLGSVRLDQENFQEAQEYYLEALTIYKQISNWDGVSHASIRLGKCFMGLGQHQKALALAQQGLKLARTHRLKDYAVEASLLLSEIYELIKKSDKALEFHKLHKAYQDSVFNETKNRQIQELETKYETVLKQEEIDRLKTDQTRQMFIRNLAIGGMFLLTIIALLLYNRMRLKSQLHRLEKDKTALLKNEVDIKNRELTTSALQAANQSQTFRELLMIMETKSSQAEVTKECLSLIRQHHSLDRDWDQLKAHFEEVHPEFFEKLKKTSSEITPLEMRHCAYIKMNLSTKEVARIMNIEPNTVKTTRYRIKKKIIGKSEQSLDDFVMSI